MLIALLALLFMSGAAQTPWPLTTTQTEEVADPEDEVLDAIAEALAGGNAKSLLATTSGRVEVWIFGRGALYSRSQALYVLQSFFDEYPPDDCAFDEHSHSKGNQFAMGRYAVKHRDAPLSVYVHLRATPTGWELREIRFE